MKLFLRDLSGSSEALGASIKYDLCREDHRWGSSYTENGSRFDRMVPLNNKGCELPSQTRVLIPRAKYTDILWYHGYLRPQIPEANCGDVDSTTKQIFKLILEGLCIRPFTRQW